MNQWGRWISLELGDMFSGVKIETSDKGSLRCAFSVERDEKPFPNNATIKVWNLNIGHRDVLSKAQSVPCRLTAGYKGNTGCIFFGALRSASTAREGPDLVTTLTAGDGEEGKDKKPISTAIVRKTWKRGTPIAAVLTQMAQALQVDLGTLPLLAPTATLPTGPVLPFALSVDGSAVEEFSAIMKSVGLTWSIQDGALQVRASELPAGMVPLISPLTGLVGSVEKSVEKDKAGKPFTQVTGKCLLLPLIYPGWQIVLTSADCAGLYLCTKVTHAGDTHAGEWYTTFEAK